MKDQCLIIPLPFLKFPFGDTEGTGPHGPFGGSVDHVLRSRTGNGLASDSLYPFCLYYDVDVYVKE